MRRILLSAALAALSSLAAAQNPIPASDDIFVVEASTERPTIAVGGTVVPFREVTFAAQLPGRIKTISGIEGDAFEAGKVLIELDEAELVANRSAAVAALNAAEADMRNAGVQYNRELWSPQGKASPGGMGIPNLFDQVFTRPMEDFVGGRDRDAERSADLYASTTRIEQARSQIMRAQSEIQAIDAKLRDAKSIAPFDGVIMQKMVEEGDTIQPGQPMLTFSDVTWLQVEVDVPARLAQGLQAMMILKQSASFDDHPEAVDVRVAQIFPMADMQRHTIKVKFDIPQGVSKPGMYAKVLIPDVTAASSMSQMPAIPSSAIRYRGNLPIVYVKNMDGYPELRMVREGKHLGNGLTTILSGIAEGDMVYANPGPDMLSRPQRKKNSEEEKH